MISFRSFLAGCWFGCRDHVRERRGKSYLLVCSNCGSETKVLPGQKPKYRKVTVKRPSKSLQFTRSA